jgi:hypothetical protein
MSISWKAGVPFFVLLVIAYAVVARRRAAQRVRDDTPTTVGSTK